MGNLGKYLLILVMYFSNTIYSDERPDIYLRYVDGIVDRFAKEMKKKHGLVCIGSGGRMPHKVEEITLFFDCYQHASIEEARILYVTIVDQLVEMINNHERIRPFLQTYPFPTEGAGICVSFNKKRKGYYLDGSVAFMGQGRGKKLHYSKAEIQQIDCPSIIDGLTKEILKPAHTDEEVVLVDLWEEPYEEAERIVHNAQNQSVSCKK